MADVKIVASTGGAFTIKKQKGISNAFCLEIPFIYFIEITETLLMKALRS